MKIQWLEYLYLNRIVFEIHFHSSKSTLEVNKYEERSVAWKWPLLLVTSPHRVTLWTEKYWRLASSKWQSVSFVNISFFIKIEMMLRFHKLENLLSMFISVYSYVILL